jgi:hypothetical protein
MDSEMNNGYPTIADIDDILAAAGIEIMTENNPMWYDELKQTIWGLLNAANWALSLGVYCPSSATFNVRGGKYLWKETVKTYTPSTAVDPTNNDTTYIWMDDANTIGSAIDGTGWPTTAHIKLAEIDVDSGGVITAIRDLRGETFLHKVGDLTGSHVANIGANGGVPFILPAAIVAGSTVVIHNANAPFKYRVIKAWSIATTADGGTWQVKNGANAITDAVAVTATDKAIDSAGTIDDAYHEVAAAGSLSVVGDGSLADAIVYIECVRVA